MSSREVSKDCQRLRRFLSCLSSRSPTSQLRLLSFFLCRITFSFLFHARLSKLTAVSLTAESPPHKSRSLTPRAGHLSHCPKRQTRRAGRLSHCQKCRLGVLRFSVSPGRSNTVPPSFARFETPAPPPFRSRQNSSPQLHFLILATPPQPTGRGLSSGEGRKKKPSAHHHCTNHKHASSTSRHRGNVHFTEQPG